MAQGYIIARVYTSRSLIPIEDASVSVTQTTNGKNMIIGFRKTDANGRTTPITLETPDEDLSQAPTGIKPFAVCDIQIEHPLYYTVFVKDAQVFADNTAVQDVELIPIEAHADSRNAVKTFQVIPQNL